MTKRSVSRPFLCLFALAALAACTNQWMKDITAPLYDDGEDPASAVPAYYLTLYVDENGSDANNGTEAAPLGTLAEALRRTARAYANSAWPGKSTASPARPPAGVKILIGGTVNSASISIAGVSSLYGFYPPILLAGKTGGDSLNKLDAAGSPNVVYVNNADVTLGAGLALTWGGVSVSNGGAFTMSGGSITGNAGSGVFISYGGTFTMSGGSITGNTGSGVSVDDGTFTMSGGNITGNAGTGVSVSNGGTFTMTGGTIGGNNAFFGYGGGVYVYDGTFTMTGGTISGNNAPSGYGGGVYVNAGTFAMSGDAKISGNNAPSGFGGGVYMDGGTFTMGGDAKISGNNAADGGGVYSAYTVFTMTGGTIGGGSGEENTAAASGGGVHMAAGNFIMPAGSTAAVRGNTAVNGGGVYFNSYGGAFTMDGGTIDGNTTSSSGGGVYVLAGDFTMDGQAEISGNEATAGGGIYFSASAGTFTMTGGTIGGNKALSGSGGGVYFSAGAGTFTMTGGTVGGNTASSYGGGVYVGSGTFTKDIPSGTGVIYGNYEPVIALRNTVLADGCGHAVWVDTGAKKRDSTVVSGEFLDSTVPSAPPWE